MLAEAEQQARYANDGAHDTIDVVMGALPGEIAYEFQEAVVEVLAKKLVRAGAKHEAKTLGICG